MWAMGIRDKKLICMSDKAVKRETEKLKEQIKAIEHCKNAVDGVEQILRYRYLSTF